ncbi:hypothetical protein VCSRO12_1484 [Vibrio cholerae]|uniref:hypothetical protein n=1 Tax=Vibrio cholerae TaxID=666 RepID=UPI0011D40DF5|nr:hypothetical protein [Vibrio cholerae]TXZ91086.1 hypothetical protein FXE42_05185 [Vibrio cholerae]GHW45007.1 hypothetical protein VCSRO56_3688 [Vibrio cholerae]GHY62845.1 hypothetical protein VCSRO12_1484 [Vibrio cholerae]
MLRLIPTKDGAEIRFMEVLLSDTPLEDRLQLMDQLFQFTEEQTKVRVVSEDFYQQTRKLLPEDLQYLDQYNQKYNLYRNGNSLNQDQLEAALTYIGYSIHK